MKKLALAIAFMLLVAFIVVANNVSINDTFSNETIHSDDGIINVSVDNTAEQVMNETSATGPAATSLHLELDASNGDMVEFIAYLTSEESPIRDEPVNFYIDDEKIGHTDTDEDGKASILHDISLLTEGTHGVMAYFMGSSLYLESSDFTELVTEAAISEIQPALNPDVPQIVCDYETVQVDEPFIVIRTEEICMEKSEIVNGTNMTIGEECSEYERQETQTKKVDKEVCRKGTKRIEFMEQVLNFEELHQNCHIEAEMIVCDETCYFTEDGRRECPDSNGDGICQPGETCFFYPIENLEIKEPQVKNGRIDITEKHVSRSFLEAAR